MGNGIIDSFFNNALVKFHEGPHAVGYGSVESQRIRFQVLSEISDLRGKSVLDVGCGLGDFYRFLSGKLTGQLREYLGIDINENMIRNAQERLRGGVFEKRDLVQEPLSAKFDYVFESGIFNIEVPNWDEIVYPMLMAMFGVCRIGMAVNFLSAYSPFDRDEKSHYVDPAEMLNYFCQELTSWVVLRQDYKANDFTIYAYRVEK